MALPLNENIFKAYDIRGVYGKDFDAEFAVKLGMAVVEHTQAGKILLAHDGRKSSDELAGAVAKGITLMGADAIDISRASSPLFYFGLNKISVGGGVMVTASHLDEEFNGFKLIGKNCEHIYQGHGMEDIARLIKENQFLMSKYTGKILKKDPFAKEYVEFLIKAAGAGKNKVKNAINIIAPPIFDDEIRTLFQELNIVKAETAKFSFEFDSDGDRLSVYESGQKIPSDWLTGVLASGLKKGFFKKPKVVYDLRFSHKVISFLNDTGIKTIRSKIGHVFIKELMMRNDADLGGELSGHIYFREMGGFESPLLAMLKILKLLSDSGKSLDELCAPFRGVFNSGEISIQIKENSGAFHKKIIDGIISNYQGGQKDFLDGITVEQDDYWFNVRFSNTEPAIKFLLETKTKEIFESEMTKLETLLESFK